MRDCALTISVFEKVKEQAHCWHAQNTSATEVGFDAFMYKKDRISSSLCQMNVRAGTAGARHAECCCIRCLSTLIGNLQGQLPSSLVQDFFFFLSLGQGGRLDGGAN